MRPGIVLFFVGCGSVAVEAQPPGVVINKERVARTQTTVMPAIHLPIPFNTVEADGILSVLEVFPADNPWNIPVDSWPIATNSKAMVALIGAGKPLR